MQLHTVPDDFLSLRHANLSVLYTENRIARLIDIFCRRLRIPELRLSPLQTAHCAV